MSTKNNSGVIFSDQVRALMIKKGVNQKALSEGIGITQGMVSKWLNGAVPKGDKLSALAQFFEVSTDELLTGQKVNYPGRMKNTGKRAQIAKDILETIDAPEEYKQIIFEGLMMWALEKDVGKEIIKEYEKRQELIFELVKLRKHLDTVISKMGMELGHKAGKYRRD